MAAFSTPIPAQLNLQWSLASTWLLVIELLDATGQVLPAEVADLQMRIADASEVILDLRVSDGVSFPDPQAPFALVAIDPARQAAFLAGSYRYEVRLVTPSLAAYALQFGTITVSDSLFAEFAPPADPQGGGQLDFSNPANSGLIPNL